MRYSQHKVLLTVSPLLPSSLQQPGVCSRNQLLLPSSAPRSVNISILLRRLRILPVATSVYYPLQRRQRSGIQAFGSANSFAYKQLPPLSPLFALFSALPSFVFNGLQPLLRKHPGWWWVPRPAVAPTFALLAPKPPKHASVTPLFATLMHSPSRKSFACHSYENTRDGGANGAVSDALRLPQSATSVGGLRVELRETGFPSRQCRFFLAEGEAHVVRPVARIIVKTGTGNGGYADFFDQIFRERHILRSCGETNRVRIGKARNVGHDVIRTARLENRKAGVLQNFQQPRALLRIASRKFVVVTLWRIQCDRAGLLQRSGRAHGKEIVDLANRRCRFRRSDGPADAPAGDTVGLGHAVDHDGALVHAIDARHGDVLGAVVQNVLVNFIGDAERVPAHAKIANEFQLRTREHFAGRIVRRIENKCFRMRPERRGQFVFVIRPKGILIGRRTHLDEARRRAAENRVRPIIFVERLEHHDFVAGIDDGHHRRHHRFRRAAANGDFALGIDAHTLRALEFLDDSVAQRLRTPGDGVLVDVVGNGLPRCFLDFRGRGEIRETLRKVDGVVLQRQPRHFANHRFGELFRLRGKHAPGDLRHRRFIHSWSLEFRVARRKSKAKEEKEKGDNAEVRRTRRFRRVELRRHKTPSAAMAGGSGCYRDGRSGNRGAVDPAVDFGVAQNDLHVVARFRERNGFHQFRNFVVAAFRTPKSDAVFAGVESRQRIFRSAEIAKQSGDIHHADL